MDAFALLNRVSEAYRNLRSLTAEATIISESGDEDSNQRNAHRVRFSYVSPDRIRFERLGRHGILQVSDGTQVHTLHRHMGPMQRGPRYHSMPARPDRLPQDFRPDLPFGVGNESLLFGHIDTGITEAERLPDEDRYYVVSVAYEPGLHPAVTTTPFRFWVDPTSFCVMRLRTDTGHRFPAHDEITWTRHTLVVRGLRIDEPIADGTFDFTPPDDAITMPRGVMGGGGGGGFIRGAASGRGGLEHQSSHEWQGETLIEHSRWKVRGVMLTFERRITFSDGDSSVEIVERATGPKGHTETRSALDLSH